MLASARVLPLPVLSCQACGKRLRVRKHWSDVQAEDDESGKDDELASGHGVLLFL